VKVTTLFFFSFFLAVHLPAQNQGKKYPDGHGGTINLPQGDISFADEVLDFKRGQPPAIEDACDSTTALGLPDFKGGLAEHFTSLGCGGILSLRFIDNAVINIPGPDLFVFEVGKYIETTQLYVSKDGNNWINVGAISGGTTAVDIGDSVKQGEIFHYVKLVDLNTDCKGDWPGADIDAVAAIGSGEQISINNGVLYKTNEFQLLPGAKTMLDSIVYQIKIQRPSQVVIEGHTDNTGVENQNQVLSEKRAKSVKDYLTLKLSPLKVGIRTIGYGSKLPLASNETKDGQNRNRRVSIILIP
jgi:outer membrane protein OmpA-like peptidoglycan-associated protein